MQTYNSQDFTALGVIARDWIKKIVNGCLVRVLGSCASAIADLSAFGMLLVAAIEHISASVCPCRNKSVRTEGLIDNIPPSSWSIV